jgi:hypothetical protein
MDNLKVGQRIKIEGYNIKKCENGTFEVVTERKDHYVFVRVTKKGLLSKSGLKSYGMNSNRRIHSNQWLNDLFNMGALTILI